MRFNSRNSHLRSLCALAFLCACAIVLLTSSAFAAFSKVGTTGAAFLKISVGRPTGMGDAFCAVADDPSATWYNPAGIAHLGRREIMLNHIQWIAGMNHEHLAGILPISGIGTVGLSVTALGTGDIAITTIDNPSTRAREDTFTGVSYSGNDFAVTATYARLITDKLAFGLSAKGVTEQIYNSSASGVGLDIGLLYNTGFNNLRIGAAVMNFGSDLSFSGLNLDFIDSTRNTRPPASYKTTPAPLPIIFRFGLAYDVLNAGNNKLVADVDLVHPSDINETVNFGLEYGYASRFFVRAGYILNTDFDYIADVGWTQGLSAGAGVSFTPVRGLDMKLDYGYRHQGFLGGTHRLTLGFSF
ncbi:MAG: PorV/PorQ family protein [candidate division WOR-3 bacterium]